MYPRFTLRRSTTIVFMQAEKLIRISKIYTSWGSKYDLVTQKSSQWLANCERHTIGILRYDGRNYSDSAATRKNDADHIS